MPYFGLAKRTMVFKVLNLHSFVGIADGFLLSNVEDPIRKPKSIKKIDVFKLGSSIQLTISWKVMNSTSL